VLRHAKELMGMDVPVLKFKLEKIVHSRKYIYTTEQIKSIISFYQDNNDCFMRDLITILTDTGCRLSEALNINVPTDVRDGVLTITINKADVPRAIPLTPRCVEVLQNRTNFQELNIDQVQRRFKTMKRTLSLSSEATLHCLRHTFATRLVTRGASIDVVQNLLGHKNIQTTQIYAQITNVRLEDTMKLLES
jgi:site-specific recombinase XerD